MKTLRIFISSPGDVSEERDKAKQVIAALQHEVGAEVTLIPVLWEDLAIPATASFQEGIDFVLSERHRIDIAVFILWLRLGSPLGAAITKPDGSAYRSGTEREFDLMLAAYEQSGRKMPLILAYTRDDLGAFSDKLDARTQHDDALEELIRQRKLVKQFIHERFHDEQGRNLRAYHTYCEPVGFAQRLHVHLREAVHDLLGLEAAAALWTGSPYRSLEVFDIQHAPIFFGRDEETCDVLQRLREQQASGCAFVCIVGASGSGKSSLARAGVAATLLHRRFDDGIKAWHTAVFIPGHAQGDLFPALTRTLATALPALRDGIGGLDKLTQCFESQNHEAASILIDTALRHSNKEPGTKNQELRVLLILDQMEELWTDRSITPEQREKFLQTIESLARTGSISVLATLRSDFYPQAQLSEAFLRMKAERGHFDLTPPGTTALQQLIVQPARRAGLRFERDEHTGRTLDQRILEDAARDPSALPLLQYALAELYEKWSAQSPEQRNTRTLLLSHYDDMGGAEGALAKRAAQIFAQLPADVQCAMEEILPSLVSIDLVGEQNAVRRRAPMAELTATPARRSLSGSLIKARFLTTDEDKATGNSVVSLAHEALLRRWDRIASWINANRDLLRIRSRIEQYEAMWKECGGDDSRLLPAGLSLEEGRKLMTERGSLMPSDLQRFVEASVSHHRAATSRKNRVRRLVAVGLSVLTVASLVGGAAALWQWQNANTRRKEAEAQKENTREALARVEVQLERSQLEVGRTWLERARNAQQRGDPLSALFLAGRSVGFAGYGRIASETEAFATAFPLLLGAPMSDREAEAARQDELSTVHRFIEDLAVQVPVWSSPSVSHHDSEISALVVSPSGKLLATASSAPENLRVWDTVTGRMLASFRVANEIQSLCFNADETEVIGFDESGAISRFQYREALVHVTHLAESGHRLWGPKVFLTQAGTRLMITGTASTDMQIDVWDVPARRRMVQIQIEAERLKLAALSGDGTRLAYVGSQRDLPDRIHVWDIGENRELTVWDAGGECRGLALTHDGRSVAAGFTNGPARLWEAGTGKLVRDLRGSQKGGKSYSSVFTQLCCFSQDGRFLFEPDYEERNRLRIWNVATGEALPALNEANAHLIASSADGQIIAAALHGGRISVWDAGQPQPRIDSLAGGSNGFGHIVFTNDGRQLITTGGGGLQHWDLTVGMPLPPMTVAGRIVAVGAATYVTADTGTLEIHRVGSRNPPALIKLASSERRVELSVDEATLVCTTFNSGKSYVEVFDAKTGRERTRFECKDPRDAMGITSDGRLLYGCSRDGVTVWSLESGKAIMSVKGGDTGVHTAAISGNGQFLAMVERDAISVLQVPSGQKIAELPRSEGSSDIYDVVAFMPNRRTLALASRDEPIRLWDFDVEGKVKRLIGHAGLIQHIVFSPDGRYLAGVASNSSVTLWDLGRPDDMVSALRVGLITPAERAFKRESRRTLYQNAFYPRVVLASAGNARAKIYEDMPFLLPISFEQPSFFKPLADQRTDLAVSEPGLGTELSSLNGSAQKQAWIALLIETLERAATKSDADSAAVQLAFIADNLAKVEDISADEPALVAAAVFRVWHLLGATSLPDRNAAVGRSLLEKRSRMTVEQLAQQVAVGMKADTTSEEMRSREATLLARLGEIAASSLEVTRLCVDRLDPKSGDWRQAAERMINHPDRKVDDLRIAASRASRVELYRFARDILIKGIEQFPEDYMLNLMAAWALVNNDEVAAAGERFRLMRDRKPPELNGGRIIAHWLAGCSVVAELAGDAESAVEHFKVLMQTSPDVPWMSKQTLRQMPLKEDPFSALLAVQSRILAQNPELIRRPSSFEVNKLAESDHTSWSRSADGGWTETSARRGEVIHYNEVRRDEVGDDRGTVLAKVSDPAFEVFIPDIGLMNWSLPTRTRTDGVWSDWQNGGFMRNVQ